MSLDLYEHQREACKKSLRRHSFGLFMETGTGKTPTAIYNMRHHAAKKKAMTNNEYKALVVCPLSIIESVWMTELPKWWKGVVVQNLWEARKKKLPINKKANVYIINYESAKKLNKKWVMGLDQIVLDESSKTKDPKSQTTKFFHSIADLNPDMRWLLLSGTPAPNSLLEYWSQMYLVDKTILGPNYYRFRANHFYTKGFNKFVWLPKKTFADNVGQILSRGSFAVAKKDCLDLPEQVFLSKTYTMNNEQQKAYKEMVKLNMSIVQDHTNGDGDVVLGANELAKIMKLRQITAGFAIGEKGEEVSISNAKLNLLEETLEEIGDNQVIIWCQFHWEINQIKKLLGDKAVTLYGGNNNEEKQDAIKGFQQGRYKYLIAHPRTAGHGLNFNNAAYSVYFSMSYSYEEEKQSKDRNHRIGQGNNVTYVYLLAKGSIDETIYNAILDKKKVSDAVLQEIHESAT